MRRQADTFTLSHPACLLTARYFPGPPMNHVASTVGCGKTPSVVLLTTFQRNKWGEMILGKLCFSNNYFLFIYLLFKFILFYFISFLFSTFSGTHVRLCVQVATPPITPALYELHWLPIAYRIKFKILFFTFKSIYGLTLSCLRVRFFGKIQIRILVSKNGFWISLPKSENGLIRD